MRQRVALLGSVFVTMTACGGEVTETDEYQQGYDEGYADAAAEYQQMVDNSREAIDSARSAVSDAQAAAQTAAGEAGRFEYDDWSDVVGNVQSATEEADTYASDAETYLDDAEGALDGY